MIQQIFRYQIIQRLLMILIVKKQKLSFSNPCVTSNDKKDGCCYNADPTEEVYCNRKDTYCYKYPNDFNYRAS